MAGAFNIELLGAKSVISRLIAAKEAGEKVLGAAMYSEALKIFAVSQRRTPVKTGALKASGYVTTPHTAVGGGVEIIIGYGGPAAPYAIYVHEITTNYHRPPTQAKFLESAVMDAAETFGAAIGKKMSGAITSLKSKGLLS